MATIKAGNVARPVDSATIVKNGEAQKAA